uniref:Fraternine n=1 Tax=Parachartergus fraternus TaxID=91406 RepID=FRAT_PARFA|nr:RecName: Full=Fraternine [Parachartergus fraternus]
LSFQQVKEKVCKVEAKIGKKLPFC